MTTTARKSTRAPRRTPTDEVVRVEQSANVYQQNALRTIGQFRDYNDRLAFATMEINSEAGELANLVYKHIWQGHPLDREKMMLELGDVLWGICVAADTLGYTMQEVMDANIAKLKRRYPNGFSSEDSIARVDTLGDPYTWESGE